jgi:hypothetical protein
MPIQHAAKLLRVIPAAPGWLMRRKVRSRRFRECQLLGRRAALGSALNAFGGEDINSISPCSPHVLSPPASHCERQIRKATQTNPTLLSVGFRVPEDPRPIDRPLGTASALQEQPSAIAMHALICRPAASISEHSELRHVCPASLVCLRQSNLQISLQNVCGLCWTVMDL